MADHNPFRWVEIYVQDMARARKFYETVCKLKLEKLPSPEAELWAFPMAPNAAGAAGALVKMEGMPSGGNSTIVYFASDFFKATPSPISGRAGRR